MSIAAEPDLEPLLAFLKEDRGFDFTGYKRSTLQRRIEKRMQEVGVESYAAYTERLELHPEEFEALFNTILINVTAFFRDPETWEHLRDQALPALLDRKAPDAPVRVWSAACSSGQEAYTAAIALCELMGEEAFKERVKIYATDVDDEALEQARAAVYTAKQLEGLPDGILERYFEPADRGHQFRSDLRRTVIFGRNDLVQDAPISRVDLLLCRNALMYFNADTQADMLRRLHFALHADGVLVLGRSETLIRHSELFEPLDLRSRTFRKVLVGNIRERLRLMARDAHGTTEGGPAALRERAFDVFPGSHVVIDADNALVAANAEARERFGLTEADLLRPVQDLELSYRPIELRAHIEAVAVQRRPLRLTEVTTTADGGEQRVYEVRLTPMSGADEAYLGTAITFLDVTSHHRLQAELQRSQHELEHAYEELQSTVEELETTNEELQSTNEELETTNEELQSSNEELETMNEELQSTNEELETINGELRERSLELDEVNAFLETILTSMGTAVAVVDRTGLVQVWNSHATDLWGLRSDEAVGEHFLVLDIGLPVEQLKTELKSSLAGAEPRIEKTLDATSRLGRPTRCEITLLPLTKGDEPTGAIILMTPAEEG
ncbi:MAG: cheBR, two-component system, chemotaxis family, CheB/CheR fusion protein [Solirubrobacterales bacterium]|nr:cheBR, two-component system, chemotaxis family, CheB/CheR fusion protein [Solirubrobacterales bacterium]